MDSDDRGSRRRKHPFRDASRNNFPYEEHSALMSKYGVTDCKLPSLRLLSEGSEEELGFMAHMDEYVAPLMRKKMSADLEDDAYVFRFARAVCGTAPCDRHWSVA